MSKLFYFQILKEKKVERQFFNNLAFFLRHIVNYFSFGGNFQNFRKNEKKMDMFVYLTPVVVVPV